MKRILVTGSRDWADERAIELALLPHLPGRGSETNTVVLVHGACPTGADELARTIWTANGGIEEPHPADWRNCAAGCDPRHRKSRADGSTYCPTAGFRRNIEMVDLGADLVLAFRLNGSRGTTHTIDLARKAGIPVTVVDR